MLNDTRCRPSCASSTASTATVLLLASSVGPVTFSGNALSTYQAASGMRVSPAVSA